MNPNDKQASERDNPATPPDVAPCTKARIILEKFKRESAEYLEWIKSFQAEEDSGGAPPSI
jgi:hypothetical protein